MNIVLELAIALEYLMLSFLLPHEVLGSSLNTYENLNND
jgi:hypothetical protein